MDNFQIETAQNIAISQQVAHLTTRLGSYLIDRLIIMGYVFLVALIMFVLDFKHGFDAWVFYLLLGLPILLYSLVFEVLMNGQTPGKQFNKIRVVKLDGSKPTFSSYLLRWMLNIVDFTMSSGSVAMVCILATGKGQRLGDMAGGTAVISEKKRVTHYNNITTEISDTYIPNFPQVTILTDTDIQTIKNVYYNAKKNHNHEIISKLQLKIIALTQIKSDLTAMDFIDTVLKDYAYYTQQ